MLVILPPETRKLELEGPEEGLLDPLPPVGCPKPEPEGLREDLVDTFLLPEGDNAVPAPEPEP